MKKTWTIFGILITVFTMITVAFSAANQRRVPARKNIQGTTQSTNRSSSQSGSMLYVCRINTQAYTVMLNSHRAIMEYHFDITDNGSNTNNSSAISLSCNEDREGGQTGIHDRIQFQTITETIRFYEFALNKTIYLRRSHERHQAYYIGE